MGVKQIILYMPMQLCACMRYWVLGFPQPFWEILHCLHRDVHPHVSKYLHSSRKIFCISVTIELKKNRGSSSWLSIGAYCLCHLSSLSQNTSVIRCCNRCVTALDLEPWIVIQPILVEFNVVVHSVSCMVSTPAAHALQSDHACQSLKTHQKKRTRTTQIESWPICSKP